MACSELAKINTKLKLVNTIINLLIILHVCVHYKNFNCLITRASFRLRGIGYDN